jgi:hypothetical protein
MMNSLDADRLDVDADKVPAAPIAPVINLIGPSDEALIRENYRLEREVRRLESLLAAEEANRPVGAESSGRTPADSIRS